MRPGQLEPNEFELAILARLGEQEPSIAALLEGLRVLSREFTGVGSYTNFQVGEVQAEKPLPPTSLDRLINVPGVPNGVAAVLYFSGEQPKMLELVAYGHEPWDGVYDGFTIEETA